MIDQLKTKKGLSDTEARKACELYRSEYVGQNSHSLWQWAIDKAKAESA